MAGKKLNRWWGVALVGLLVGIATQAAAASLVGGQTDDSVCYLGRAPQNARQLSGAAEFIRTQCKNGQALTGSGIVPAGNFESDVVRLARSYCRISDIQIRQTQGNMMGLVMEFDEIRCTIEKLPK